jgi:hypothetical protein
LTIATSVMGYTRSVFPPGTPHHAAEIGSLQELQSLVAEGARRGYPAAVVLQQKDEILGAQPLHVAAEKGRVEVIKVRRVANPTPVACAPL